MRFFLLISIGMTTQLLKPPTKTAHGTEQEKSGITLVKREEIVAKEDTIEEVKTSKDQVKVRRSYRYSCFCVEEL